MVKVACWFCLMCESDELCLITLIGALFVVLLVVAPYFYGTYMGSVTLTQGVKAWITKRYDTKM